MRTRKDELKLRIRDFSSRLYYCSDTGEGRKMRHEIEKAIRKDERELERLLKAEQEAEHEGERQAEALAEEVAFGNELY